MAVPIVGHKKKREAQLVIIKCNFYKQTLPIIADCVLLAVLTTSFLFFPLKVSQSSKIYVQPQGKFCRMDILA